MKIKPIAGNKTCNNFKFSRNFKNKFVIVLVIFLLCIHKDVTCSDGDGEGVEVDIPQKNNFVEKCEQRCRDQNRTQFDTNDEDDDEEGVDTVCKSNCTIKQCDVGCSLWESALDSSCQRVCNKSEEQSYFDNRQIYCIKGCNDASNFYFQWIKQEVQSPIAPALIPDSLTSTSLSLEWSVPLKFSELAKGNLFKKTKNEIYFVQCYEDFEDDWKQCGLQTIFGNSTIHMENMQPYTRYKFRVALVLSENEAIYSEPSVIISTNEEGIPVSEPQILQVGAVDQTRIMVSWRSGLRNNGPILSYNLQIRDMTHGYTAIKEVPASNQTNYYIFEKLSPERNYSIQIRTRNARGVGPYTEATTMTAPYLKDPDGTHEIPKLLLATEQKIVSQGKDFLAAQPNTVYMTNTSKITALAINVRKKLIFVAEENGCIYQGSLDLARRNEKREVICQKNGLNFKPSLLSVDWLNDHLYIMGEMTSSSQHQSIKSWSISRCDYDGKKLIVAVGGLNEKPAYIEVDPYNGYLFWVITGESMAADGLFKLDLGEISNGIKHETKPTKLIESTKLGAFVVDPTRFRLLVPYLNENTIMAVSLSGNAEDIRKNTQSSLLHSVKSLVQLNGLFYWTNGKEYRAEEYHEKHNSYYHNSYPDATNTSVIAIRVNSSVSQPIPVPLNPPKGVQALLSSDRAKISWETPEAFGEQGKGAFKNWFYKLEVSDGVKKQEVDNISGNAYIIESLQPDQLYSFKVAAYTSGGSGQWSKEFKTKTLKSSDERHLIWASGEGLMQSDVTGENIFTLVSKEELGDVTISDVSWYDDLLYIVANASLRIYNRTSGSLAKLNEIDNVGGVAIDWIGKRLYWSNPSQQVIQHSNLMGRQAEPLPFSATVREIKIDAMRGNIYYSTGLTIESCRLNGRNERKYFRVEPYSGKQVLGLTLDMDNQMIYWIVKSNSGTSLFSAKFMDMWSENDPLIEEKLTEKNLFGPLIHFSDRLVWRQNDRTIVFSDMNGKNLAFFENEKLNGLTYLVVIDKTHHQYPKTPFSEVVVIPNAVAAASVQIIGTYKFFNITWDAVKNVNYGDVSYDIRVKAPKNPDVIAEQQSNVFQFQQHSPNNTLEPFTPLEIHIRASTFWGASALTKVQITSPPGFPSEPTNPRVFTRHLYKPLEGNVQISAIFRWSLPKQPNGKILGYKVRCSESDGSDQKLFENKTVTNLEQVFEKLKKDTDYVFEVQAYTEVGDGNFSETVKISTTYERPVPRVLVSTQEDIIEVDLDKQQSNMVQSTRNPIVVFTHIAHESKLYWFNDNNELESYNMETREKVKLLSTNSTVQAMTIDWIGRVLYWSQNDENRGAIYSYNLNRAENNNYRPFNDQNHALKIVERKDVISDLVVSPYDRKLFWIENHEKVQEESGIFYLDLDSSEVKMFFDENDVCLNQTTLTMSPNPGSLIFATSPVNSSENMTFRRHESILIFEMRNGFTATDIATKKCFDFGSIFNEKGSNLAKDSNKVYWINEGLIYARDDFSHKTINLPVPPKSNRLLAFYQQYFPKKRCLVPINKSKRVKLLASTDTTLRIELPRPELLADCKLKSVPIKYTILYTDTELGNLSATADLSCLHNGYCHKIETYDRIETIERLNPFTHYSIQIALSSVFDRSERLQFGDISDFRTDSGTPSPPRNISAVALSFNEVLVTWQRPATFNAPKIYYKILWETIQTEGNMKNNHEMTVNDSSDRSDNAHTNEYLSTILNKVAPNHKYKISVSACSKNETCSESEKIYVVSYPEPEHIKLSSMTPTSMIIEWNAPENASQFEIQYSRQDAYDSVSNVSKTHMSEHPNYFLVDNLEPKTKYNFSIVLRYVNSNRTYRWMPHQKIEFETHGDVPSPPGRPIIEFCKEKVCKIVWNASKENGAPVLEYVLESMKIHNPLEWEKSRSKRAIDDSNDILLQDDNNDIEDVTELPNDIETEEKERWIRRYNGTDTHFIATELEQIDQHVFRVQAQNSYGWSAFSPISDLINSTLISGKLLNNVKAEQTNMLIVGVSLLFAFVVLFVSVVCFIFVFYRNRRNKKMRDDGLPIPDFEMMALRDMQAGENMLIQNRNILYNHFYGPAFLNPEIKHLPQIHQNQIIVTDRCLGKGAFGEVWSGIVKNDDGSEELVAIKTLHKGANDVEKREFLQEAQLMSNFKHDHILRLIGICLNQNDCLLYIVMELMVCGDLLSFLRNNRPTMSKQSPLKLVDLISMCVDVASGCRYLEEMHFVHRDIAARNCLVKTTPDITGLNLVVKIGDFGLARDIYKNDYYRKEGEGLLPVRWMAPESLIDGVFTSQSDIWAFGVLMWEVMTLGHQPYPARTNIEVLQYVRSGGRLHRPHQNCPEELYQLMTKCWNRVDQRPTFRYCLEILTQLHENYTYLFADVDLPFPNDMSCKYVSSDDSSIMNEKLNSSETNETSGEHQAPTSIPKYLELMYDENDERSMENLCEAPLNYSDKYQKNSSNNSSNFNGNTSMENADNHQRTVKDEGYEIPISFDNEELDINANNELNNSLSKSRTLSNSSTISHKSDHNQQRAHTPPPPPMPHTHPHLSHHHAQHPIFPMSMDNCKRSSLILDRDHNKIYPQTKILANGVVAQIKHQSGWV